MTIDQLVAEAGKLCRFVLVGLLATAVHLAVAALVLWLRPGTLEFLVNLIAFAVAFQVSLVGHRLYTFRSNGSGRRFLLVALFGFLCNNGLLAAALALTPLEGLAAITLSTLLVPAVTYLASRFWAFR
ncbi:MAG: GtrA family protein [Spongiibacteraceae bacterium]|jgi:putative flippase GtrA|nr:GtrA family protein [Spongiibacteraceae bacterium]